MPLEHLIPEEPDKMLPIIVPRGSGLYDLLLDGIATSEPALRVLADPRGPDPVTLAIEQCRKGGGYPSMF